MAVESCQWGDEHVTIIEMVCWWAEHIALFFVEMNGCVNGGLLFISKVYWDKNNYLNLYSVKSLNTSPLSPHTYILKILHNSIYYNCFVSNGHLRKCVASIQKLKYVTLPVMA